jgi:hypothetical protein
MYKAGKGDAPERKLLENVWGEVPSHCTTAIMGPSGAGYVTPCFFFFQRMMLVQTMFKKNLNFFSFAIGFLCLTAKPLY